MLRTALRPASLGLLAVMVTASVLCALLGHWQLDRAREHEAPSRTERIVPLTSVLAPKSSFTVAADHQRVRVSGTYQAGDTVLVGGHEQGGRHGSWVVTALRVTGDDGRSALLPVVRGWVPAGTEPPPAPPGETTLTGRLLISEDPQGVGAGGRVSVVSSADLVNLWEPPLYTGYLVAAAGSADSGLTPVPSARERGALDLQNLSYAFQWWLFAAFAVVFWGKVVRDRHRNELEDAAWEDEQEESRHQEAVP